MGIIDILTIFNLPIHEHEISLNLFSFLWYFFTSGLFLFLFIYNFLDINSVHILLDFIPKYFILGSAIVNYIYLISYIYGYRRAYRNYIGKQLMFACWHCIVTLWLYCYLLVPGVLVLFLICYCFVLFCFFAYSLRFSI